MMHWAVLLHSFFSVYMCLCTTLHLIISGFILQCICCTINISLHFTIYIQFYNSKNIKTIFVFCSFFSCFSLIFVVIQKSISKKWKRSFRNILQPIRFCIFILKVCMACRVGTLFCNVSCSLLSNLQRWRKSSLHIRPMNGEVITYSSTLTRGQCGIFSILEKNAKTLIKQEENSGEWKPYIGFTRYHLILKDEKGPNYLKSHETTFI